MAQRIRLQNLNREVPNSNLQTAAIVPLGKALYPHCPVPRKGLVVGWEVQVFAGYDALVPWSLAYKQLAFLVAR